MSDDNVREGKKSIPVGLRLKTHPVVLPTDLAERVVRKSSYLSLAKTCVCRVEHSCQNYPAGLGCLYLGDGAKGIVTRGNAVEVTVDQALEVVRQARAMGLVHLVLWTSGELRSLGADASKALELCSCCPCCCINRRIGDGERAYVDGITGLGIARPDGDCTFCGDCVLSCLFNALVIDEDGPTVNPDRCKSCGRCETACRHGVLKVYELEHVPSYDCGWEMIPAEAYLDQIKKIVT